MIKIGPHNLSSRAFLAPMAGISDAPFRRLCFEQGAGLCVSEMLSSKAELRDSKKSLERKPVSDDAGVRVVQLVGVDPQQLAESAKYYVDEGAQIIDINMGCPAKKVCRTAAGSALLREPKLVTEICQSVVAAVNVPVSLKIRTGWCPETRNTLEVARIAEDSGIQSLVIHGRTRACRFVGEVEYENIAAAKQMLNIPVIANGDINSAERAQWVLDYTKADGVMIGRAAQGNPWIFNHINSQLQSLNSPEPMNSHKPNNSHEPNSSPELSNNHALLNKPSAQQVIAMMHEHIKSCGEYYGEYLGPRIARKHASAYFQNWFADEKILRRTFNALQSSEQQLTFLLSLINNINEASNTTIEITHLEKLTQQQCLKNSIVQNTVNKQKNITKQTTKKQIIKKVARRNTKGIAA